MSSFNEITKIIINCSAMQHNDLFCFEEEKNNNKQTYKFDVAWKFHHLSAVIQTWHHSKRLIWAGIIHENDEYHHYHRLSFKWWTLFIGIGGNRPAMLASPALDDWLVRQRFLSIETKLRVKWGGVACDARTEKQNCNFAWVMNLSSRFKRVNRVNIRFQSKHLCA